MGLEAIKLTNLPALCKTATRQSNKTGVLNNDICLLFKVVVKPRVNSLSFTIAGEIFKVSD